MDFKGVAKGLILHIICDSILIQELAIPGSDTRCGVNLICRPSLDVKALIEGFQARLRGAEPGQYYYPPSDLHLTVFEITHSIDAQQAAEIGEFVASHHEEWSTALPRFELESPAIAFDERGCALRFRTDERIVAARRHISEELSGLGVRLMPRHAQGSAHITFMRYTRSLMTDPKSWFHILSNMSAPHALTWTVTELGLTWGATWFGMRSRVVERGPYHLY